MKKVDLQCRSTFFFVDHQGNPPIDISGNNKKTSKSTRHSKVKRFMIISNLIHNLRAVVKSLFN